MKWFIKVLKQYAGFNGRARRTEFWMFTLFNVIIIFILALMIRGFHEFGVILYYLYLLAVLLPSIAVGVRRLHDTGKSGWWMLLGIIPFVGWIILIIFFATDGQSGKNIFGEDPKGRHEINDSLQIMQTTSAAPITNGSFASIKDMKCPNCREDDFVIVGAEGSGGRTIIAAFVGWLIARWIFAGKIAADWPIQYKCKKCNRKFIGEPVNAPDDERLSAPCTIYFERISSLVGAAIPQIVHLNGMKIGTVKNGKTISFPTHVKQNVIFVTDMYGMAFPGHYTFEAQPDTSVRVSFNRKFN